MRKGFMIAIWLLANLPLVYASESATPEIPSESSRDASEGCSCDARKQQQVKARLKKKQKQEQQVQTDADQSSQTTETSSVNGSD
ncbi:MAG: hypothetical protein GY815_16545 [Gammaproteobacteria bacterium]|nr:hypothetical protein [Gammaproteobacteria bacterium]